MTEAEIISSVWPDWETVGEIGEGSSGTVWEVRRRDLPGIKAAVKVIPVPSGPDDTEALRADGLTPQDTNNPWGYSGYQSFAEFESGFLGMKTNHPFVFDRLVLPD